MKTKTYKTYQARNAVKAAQVTNHIIAHKKLGVSHIDAKAEAYRVYNIKAGVPLIKQGLKVRAYPPLPTIKSIGSLPPLPKLPPLPVGLATNPPKELLL